VKYRFGTALLLLASATNKKEKIHGLIGYFFGARL